LFAPTIFFRGCGFGLWRLGHRIIALGIDLVIVDLVIVVAAFSNFNTTDLGFRGILISLDLICHIMGSHWAPL